MSASLCLSVRDHNNRGQVVHTHTCLCHQAVKFGTGQGAVMPCGWEGNRRSGVTLAMRHRLQWFIHIRAHGLRKGDEHPAYTHRGVWHTLLWSHYTTARSLRGVDAA